MFFMEQYFINHAIHKYVKLNMRGFDVILLVFIISAEQQLPCPPTHYWTEAWLDETSYPLKVPSYSDNLHVLIGGCARNIGHEFQRITRVLDEITQQFGHTSIFLVEGNSHDNTWAQMQQWQSQTPFTRTAITKSSSHHLRTARIAECRNEILQHALSISDLDYLLMLDLDDVLRPTDISPVFDYKLTDWEVQTVNRKYYYDLWALRDPMTQDYDRWRLHDKFRRHYPGAQRLFDNGFKVFPDLYHDRHGLIPVKSAFCGAAIYNVTFLRTAPCRYQGVFETEKWGYADVVDGPSKTKRNRGSQINEICEHVPFHNCLRDHCARIFINADWWM